MPEQEYDTSVPAEEAAVETAPAAATETETPEAEVAAPEVGTPTPTFTVTVDGESFEVTAEEAIAGYQRQADYTRKTQQLASEREQVARAQQLWDAIENNPEQTITAIAKAYGITLGEARQVVENAERDPFEDLIETPEGPKDDERWQRVEQFMQEQQNREQTAAVEQELRAVRAAHGITLADPSQFDQNLIEYAIEHDIGNLDAAFKAMSYEAAQQAAARRAAAARKGNLPPVTPGHSTATGVLAPGAGSALPSFEEAFEAAQAELNA